MPIISMLSAMAAVNPVGMYGLIKPFARMISPRRRLIGDFHCDGCNVAAPVSSLTANIQQGEDGGAVTVAVMSKGTFTEGASLMVLVSSDTVRTTLVSPPDESDAETLIKAIVAIEKKMIAVLVIYARHFTISSAAF